MIKKLLQTQAADHFEIISQMAKLLDFIAVPAARASILWLIGEYNEKVPKIAPDVLRKLAKTFTDEVNLHQFMKQKLSETQSNFLSCITQEDIVKLQVLNLAVKLYLTNAVQTELLCQYVFNLARYDQNYDIRDRARFLKQFIFPASGQPTILSQNAKKIFLATKPAPLLESKYQGREQYQLGSLSHYLNMKANGYNDMPPFPDVAPDPSVRNVESPVESSPIEEPIRTVTKQSKGATSKGKTKSFYSESEKSSSEYSSDSSDSDSESESVDENGTTNEKAVGGGKRSSSDDETEDSESDSSDSSGTSSSDSDSDADDNASSSSDDAVDGNVKKLTNHAPKTQGNGSKAEKSNLDLLLDLGDITPTGPVMTPSLGGFLTPMTQMVSSTSNRIIELVGPNHIPLTSTELINKVNGYGLGVTYRFTRAPHLFSPTMVSIELLFTNHSNDVMENIKIGSKTLSPGMELNEFATIAALPAKATVQGTLGIDFNDSTQPVSFDIVTNTHSSRATIKATVGEFIRAVLMSENVYREERSKLRGMNEHSVSIPLNTTISDVRLLQQRIYECANVASVPSSMHPNALHFAGQTLSSQSLVLITIEIGDADATVMINCEKMVVGSMLLNEIKAALRN